MSEPQRLRVRLAPSDPYEQFVHYLLRLGCSLTAPPGQEARTLEIALAHPETVPDEAEALHDWLTSWRRAHPESLPDTSTTDPADAKAA